MRKTYTHSQISLQKVCNVLFSMFVASVTQNPVYYCLGWGSFVVGIFSLQLQYKGQQQAQDVCDLYF